MRRVAPAAVLAAALLLSACGGGGGGLATETPTTPSATPSPTPSPTQTTPTATFPLTGVPTDDPKADQPIVAVKIENTAAARPQAGLDAADVVYEEVVEGGITRFNALFHSQLPTEVGPVRSARLIDAEILAPLGALFVYSGARPDVDATLARSGRIGLLPDSGRPVYHRAPDRPGSHDLMADLPAALAQGGDLDEVAAAPRWLSFGPAPTGGTPATDVTVRMSGQSRTGWQWDAAAGVYRRLQNGQPQVVTGSGRVGAANVVVILTDIGTGGCCDTAGNPFAATRFTGEGDAVVLRDGKRFAARWVKPDATSHLRVTTAAGGVLPLAPGPTWIELAPIGALGD